MVITLQDKESSLSMAEFALFQGLIYRHAGIRLTEKKHALVEGRLKKLVRQCNLTSYRAYYDLINVKSQKEEFQKCVNALTTNETFFFRHKKHWDYLLQTIVPEWKRKMKPGPIRSWSAACSSGEEAYSLAILLLDSLPPHQGWDIAIDATDINQDMVAEAKSAVYDNYAVQKATRLCLGKYFTQLTPETYKLQESVRRMVAFRTHNLLDPSTGPQYDVIFLRNVLIYFDAESKNRVVHNVLSRLKHGGFLFLGGAETLGNSDQFESVKPTIYRKKLK